MSRFIQFKSPLIDWLIALALFALALWLRATNLAHFATADEHNWVYRSGLFLHALLQKDWPETSVWYTPAVTTTWLGSAGLTVYYYLHQSAIDRPFLEWLVAFSRNKIDLDILLALRWSMALFTALMSAVVYGLARKLWSRPVALLGALFLLTEPHLLAVSRIIGHDAPLTFFVAASLLALFYARRQLVVIDRRPPTANRRKLFSDSLYKNESHRSRILRDNRWWRGLSRCKRDLLGLFSRESDRGYATATRMKIFRPHPVGPQAATPLAQSGRGAGGEGLFSRENLKCYGWFALSGALAGLALLSKAPALILIPFVGLMALVDLWQHKNRLRHWFWALLIWGAALWLTFILLWPAAWVDPLGQTWFVISTAFSSSAGLEDADLQPHWSIPNLGYFYYLVHGTFKASPFLLVGVILAGLSGWRKLRRRKLLLPQLAKIELTWLLLFALLFALMMTLSIKRSPRYILPSFPALTFVAAWGWLYVLRRLNKPAVIAALSGLAILVTLNYAPYYFTYYNPLLGGGLTAPKIVRIGWGEGLDQLGRWLNTQPDAAAEQVGARYTATLYPFYNGQISSPVSEELDYVAFYIKQTQSGYPAPEILAYFNSQKPLHRVVLDGIEYARVYQGPGMQPVQTNGRSNLPIAYRPHTIYAPIGGNLTVDLLWGDAPSGMRTPGEPDRPSPSPHPVASATPLSQPFDFAQDRPGRGAGREGRFSGEPVILTLQTAGAQPALESQASIIELAPQVRVSRHSFHIPADMARAEYTLSLEGKSLGKIKARLMNVPSDFTPRSVVMAGQLKLAGFRRRVEDSQLLVDLAWQGWPQAANDYTVFVQLLDENEQRVAGVDVAPERGFTLLERKEVMLTHYNLPLPDNLEPGQYKLLVGLYYFAGDKLINVGAVTLEEPIVLK